jgi:putative transposase
MTTSLVLDAVEHAIWTPNRCGTTDLSGLVHHHDAGSQYTSITFTQRLAEAGINPSIGTSGDSFDNALAETINGLYKAELVYGPDAAGWDGVDELELATLSWVHWFNHKRLHSHCDDTPPVEFEDAFDAAQHTDRETVGIQ